MLATFVRVSRLYLGHFAVLDSGYFYQGEWIVFGTSCSEWIIGKTVDQDVKLRSL